ncbi:dihydropteroate synthase [Amycolatopsis vastitatis]|uniref:Dihydropteroate synthase n=1 Tax=Amycolatopsis vastitatis TaxID=1905142 RepID=A0A229T8V7_9PSEU|nr:dihydropteroate synthase [Amycolatopsis vastitatis]OXM67685.1 dihydropteroate synthase [Amycolatopsis vastitatis]
MKTPDLVFRGRRLSSDRALVLAAVEVLPDTSAARTAATAATAAQVAARNAVADGADLVSFAGTGVEPLVAWARETFPSLFVAVDTADPSDAAACCEAGADLVVARADLSGVAARFGTGYAASSVPGAAGLPAEGVVLDAGVVRTAVPPPGDFPVLAEVAGDGTPGGLALAALAASAGVAIIRTAHVRRVRQVAEMAASIAGTRPPAKAVRWE